MKTKESERERIRKWRKENPERARLNNLRATEVARKNGKWKEHTERYINKYPERYLYRVAKSRAKKYNLDFSLDIEDVVIPELCPVFSVPMERNTRYAPSLDRKDSSRGYTKDNIQVISRLANTMKNNATEKELEQFAKWILNER